MCSAMVNTTNCMRVACHSLLSQAQPCLLPEVICDWLFSAIVIGRGGEFNADSGGRHPLRRMDITCLR